MRKRLLARFAAAAAGGALAFAAAAPAFADHNEETAVTTVPEGSEVTVEHDDIPNDTGPADCGVETDKLDDMSDAPGMWTHVINGVTIEVVGDADKHYDFSITGDIDGEAALLHAIHIKGGTNDKSYYFDPPVTEASNLTPPENQGGNTTDASHIWFCFGSDEPGDNGNGDNGNGDNGNGDNGNGATPAPTATPTEPPADKPDGEDDDDQLPVTGAQVGGMVVLAGGLIAAGIAMMAVRRRRNLSELLES